MNFKQFVGQDKIKEKLIRAAKQNKVGHAYIFYGPEGMGKFTLAKAFAGAILCQENQEDYCGECLSCKKLLSGNHPDLKIISSAKASIGIDEMRALQDDIIVKPLEASKKIYIIDNADKLTVPAQNAILKTLEEPPSYAVLIFCISNMNLILKTIESRCIKVVFSAYSNQEIKKVLMERNHKEQGKIDFAASFSQGSIGKAFMILSEDFLALRESVWQLVDSVANDEMEQLLELSKVFLDQKTHIYEMLDIMLSFYRDMMILEYSDNQNMLINLDKKSIILNHIKNNKSIDISNAFRIIEKSRKDLKMNVNFQMVIDYMLLSLWEVYHGKSSRSAV